MNHHEGKGRVIRAWAVGPKRGKPVIYFEPLEFHDGMKPFVVFPTKTEADDYCDHGISRIIPVEIRVLPAESKTRPTKKSTEPRGRG